MASLTSGVESARPPPAAPRASPVPAGLASDQRSVRIWAPLGPGGFKRSRTSAGRSPPARRRSTWRAGDTDPSTGPLGHEDRLGHRVVTNSAVNRWMRYSCRSSSLSRSRVISSSAPKGLVEQEQLGLQGQRPGERDPHPHPPERARGRWRAKSLSPTSLIASLARRRRSCFGTAGRRARPAARRWPGRCATAAASSPRRRSRSCRCRPARHPRWRR
jgi:hypothetical protein